MDQYLYHTVASLYGLLATGTVFLNAVVILTFFKVRTLLIPASLPIISLAIADVVLALATMPLGIASNMSGRWLFGVAACNWYGFSHTVVGLSSILHHAIIAFERCVTIYQPLKMHFNMHRMLTIILFIWGFVAAWCFFPILGWSSYGPEGSETVCSIKWNSTENSDAVFVICTFVLFCFVPFGFIFACYTAIALNLRHMSKLAKNTWGKSSHIARDRVAIKRKAIVHGAIMVAAVLITWLPYAIVAFHVMLSHQNRISPMVYSITAMFAKTSTLMNPVICFFWYRRFREGTKKLLTKKRSGALQDGRRGCSQTSIVWHTTCSRSRVFLKGISSRSNHFKTVNGQDNAKGSKGFPKDD